MYLTVMKIFFFLLTAFRRRHRRRRRRPIEFQRKSKKEIWTNFLIFFDFSDPFACQIFHSGFDRLRPCDHQPRSPSKARKIPETASHPPNPWALRGEGDADPVHEPFKGGMQTQSMSLWRGDGQLFQDFFAWGFPGGVSFGKAMW